MENSKFYPVIDLLKRLHSINLPKTYLNPGQVVSIIDMGHGGIIDGRYTTAPNKMYQHSDDFTFYEGVFNRAVGYTLAYEMYRAGKSYILLTPTNHDVDLRMRVKLIGEWGHYVETIKGGTVYVRSIHGNAFGLQQANGIEVYTSPGNTISDPLAMIEYEELENMKWNMRADYRDGDPDKEARFKILVGHKYPAFLDELGFFTNYDQALEMSNTFNISRLTTHMIMAHLRIEDHFKLI